MDEVLAWIWEGIGGRIGGPLSFRLLLQPAVAIVLAIRAGQEDARAGRSPYLWRMLANPTERRGLLREGWKRLARVFVFAVVMDGVYQVIVFRWVHPLELFLVAFLLAWVPYLLVRGPVTRLAVALRRHPPRA